MFFLGGCGELKIGTQVLQWQALPGSALACFLEGSVYFTANILAATDQLELLPPVKHLHSVSWHDTIRIKRSVCHAVGVLLMA